MNEYTYEECIIGEKAIFQVTVTEEMMDNFKNYSGDCNPLHNDEEYACNNNFKGRVVYGMLTASFLSTLAGMYLPGKFCLIEEVDLKFARPVYVGEKIQVTGEIIEKNDLFQRLVLKVAIKNQNGENAVRGKLKVGVLKTMEEKQCQKKYC